MKQIENLFDFASGDRLVSKDVAMRLLDQGCILCKRNFDEPEILFLVYRTTDLYVIGLTQLQVAEIEIAVCQSEMKWYNEETVFIVDRKGAVCLKCWTEFLRQVAALKGSQK